MKGYPKEAPRPPVRGRVTSQGLDTSARTFSTTTPLWPVYAAGLGGRVTASGTGPASGLVVAGGGPTTATTREDVPTSLTVNSCPRRPRRRRPRPAGCGRRGFGPLGLRGAGRRVGGGPSTVSGVATGGGLYGPGATRSGQRRGRNVGLCLGGSPPPLSGRRRHSARRPGRPGGLVGGRTGPVTTGVCPLTRLAPFTSRSTKRPEARGDSPGNRRLTGTVGRGPGRQGGPV